MSWIKLDNDTFAEEMENPVRAVSLIELQERLTRLELAFSKIIDITNEDKEYEAYKNNQNALTRNNLLPRIYELKTLIANLEKL